ncbi:MAG: hypothetical protein WA821_00185 [Anaerolineales bacterium]
MPSPSEERQAKRAAFKVDSNKNVFIIMRYGKSKEFEEIETAIKGTLKDYGLRGVLARDEIFHELLWEHIKFCMENSRYTIAVFEKIRGADVNPNVALELGYMLALGKSCLILKDSSMKDLQTDIMGHLYEAFDSYAVKDTIHVAVGKWLLQLGHNTVKPDIEITGSSEIDAYKNRTKLILDELTKFENTINVGQDKLTYVIRQRASLSSLAITDGEIFNEDTDDIYKKLLIEERAKLLELLEAGIKIKLIISPYIHEVRVESKQLTKQEIKNNILPRYARLIEVIEKYRDARNFQIVSSTNDKNVLIIGNRAVCIGEKAVRERGYKNTVFKYDTQIIGKEIDAFDREFRDNAGVILKKETTQSNDHSSPELKEKVIEKLKRSSAKIEREIRKL